MMARRMTFVWLVLAVAMAGALIKVSYRVQHLQRHLASTTRQIAQEEESMRVLQAEWNYLNDPRRLESLAKKHLGMAPLTPAQIVTLDAVPEKLPLAAISRSPAKAIATATSKPLLASYKRRAGDD